MVERCTCNAAAPGSNPGGAFLFYPLKELFALLNQLSETEFAQMYLTQLQSQNEDNIFKNYNAVGRFLSGDKNIDKNFFAAEPLFELGDWMAKPNTADLHYLSGLSTTEIYQGRMKNFFRNLNSFLALTSITATGYEKGNGSLGGIGDDFIKTFAECRQFGRALQPLVRRAQAFDQDQEVLRLIELCKDHGWDANENISFESEIFDGLEIKKVMARIKGSSEVEKVELYNQIVSIYLSYNGKRPMKFLLNDRLGLKIS